MNPTSTPVVRKRQDRIEKLIHGRQTNVIDTGLGYVASVGVTAACAQAFTFAISSGALINIGLGDFVSTDPGVAYISLSTFTSGSITTTFVITNGVLHWYNSAFYGGEAQFCELNDHIYASFTSAGGPVGCVRVNLVTYSGK